MKRLVTFYLLLFAFFAPAHAVLKEKDLESTLLILRGELTTYYLELEEQSERMLDQQRLIGRNLMDIYNRSTQNSLMLYSQKKDYIFNLTYACHEATAMFDEFKSQSLPFRQLIEDNATDIARYDSLIINLEHMPQMQLSDEAKVDRNVCLTLATHIKKTLQENSDQMADYIEYYSRTEERLKSLNDYALKCYDDIQSSIFVNGGDNYYEIIKSLGRSWSSMVTAMKEQYGASSATVHFFTDQNFFVMAGRLLMQYTWLLIVIVASIILRNKIKPKEKNLKGKTHKAQFWVYAPLIVASFLVIVFRIILIPNDLVNLLFPPILVVCAIWQWVVIGTHRRKIPQADKYYSYISLMVFLASVVCSAIGYTLFSVQALIWWTMQLTCILTITCIAGWMDNWAKKKHFALQPITKTWFYNFCSKVVLRVLGIASIVIAIYWAADVFNMSDTTWRIFVTKFIDSPSFSASIYGISLVIALFFLFSWINNTAKAFTALYFEKSDHSTAASKNVLAKNLIQIIVWGLWLLISLGLLKVGNSWLLVISGGLSTGLGFASKDILENIYYGVSLMTGRVKIGDLIECDGYRGTVSSINYTSTMINIADGSVIAFQNSQLFTKNYKNLTKNHGYELDRFDVGVAYGTNVNDVRKVLVENLSKFEFLREGTIPTVSISDFGDSSVNLKIMCWVPVATYAACGNEIRECIYNTLNENNIEIPFPQLDIHPKGE